MVGLFIRFGAYRNIPAPQGGVAIPAMTVAYNALQNAVLWNERCPAFAAVLMTAVVRACSYEEKNFMCIKARVKTTLSQVADTTTFTQIASPGFKVTTKEYYAARMRGNARTQVGNAPDLAGPTAGVDVLSVPLEATKCISNGDVVKAWTDTKRPHVVNIESKTVTKNPNVDSTGDYILPLSKMRREDSIIGVIGTTRVEAGLEALDGAHRFCNIADQHPTAVTSGRKSTQILLAPSSYPVPNASIRSNEARALPRIPEYIDNSGVRCFTVFDHENEFEVLERMYAIPIIVPDTVIVKPFKFLPSTIHSITFQL